MKESSFRVIRGGKIKMKKKNRYIFTGICLSGILSLVSTVMAVKPEGGNPPPEGEYVAIGYNDLGMHCACPRGDIMMLLPPWNTLRVQVIKRASSPIVVNDPNEISVEYLVRENYYDPGGNPNDGYNLAFDSQYLDWLDSAESHFPGSGISRSNPVGLAGFGLNGHMEPKVLTSSPGQAKYWVAEGVPAYPPINNQDFDFIGPFGTKRKAYLHYDVTVKSATTGDVLATTSTTLPVAFGGCCNCHQEVAVNGGYVKNGGQPDPYDVFQSMMDGHKRDTGVDILALAGGTYDAQGHLTGLATPVRCSKCHSDLAVGGDGALDQNWVDFAGQSGHNTISPFSKVLHKFHAESSEVTTYYDADIAKNCYQCHPGGSAALDCYRGHHVNKTIGKGSSAHLIWCTDCHGDLNERVSSGQLENPWHYSTLPACNECHIKNAEQLVGEPAIFGKFLGSSGHKNGQILCPTCHGAPHALQPSLKAIDNEQNISLQGSAQTLGKCDVCHIGKSSQIGLPNHKP